MYLESFINIETGKEVRLHIDSINTFIGDSSVLVTLIDGKEYHLKCTMEEFERAFEMALHSERD